MKRILALALFVVAAVLPGAAAVPAQAHVASAMQCAYPYTDFETSRTRPVFWGEGHWHFAIQRNCQYGDVVHWKLSRDVTPTSTGTGWEVYFNHDSVATQLKDAYQNVHEVYVESGHPDCTPGYLYQADVIYYVGSTKIIQRFTYPQGYFVC